MDEPTSRPHATAHDTDAHDTDAVRRLDRRLFQARAAIAWEEFWRAIWPVIALGGLFLVIAFLDALPRLDAWLHALLLASFAAAAVVGGVLTLRRLRWPDASRAGRRLETESGLRHRPLAAEIMVNGRDIAVIRPRQDIDALIAGESLAPWLKH